MEKHLTYSVLMPLAPWEPPEQVAMALKSLEAQTLSPAQVVVSCDGEPPLPLNEVLSSTVLPIEIVLGPGGEGVGPVLARGLDFCTEDFVIRADADDISMPERCAVQVKVLSENPSIAVMSSKLLEFIDDPFKPFQTRDVPCGRTQMHYFSRWRNPINHPAVIMRRKVILENGSYRNCPGFEDYELWLRLLKNGICLDNLRSPLVLARVGADHVRRRLGVSYAIKEINFLKTCLVNNLMPWPFVLVLFIVRIPARLVPPVIYSLLMRKLFRSTARETISYPQGI